jgi:outer membrane receptor protein involved in Fe transport
MRLQRLVYLVLGSVFTAFFFHPAIVHAQATSSIRGTIYDPDGKIVPDAQVNLLDSMIAAARTQSDSNGEYRFEQLRNGVFTVTASVPGLTIASAEIKLQTGDSLTVDLHLELSAVQQQVVVSASLGGALSPQIGSSVTVVDSQEIKNAGMETVADALRSVPGVAINRSGQMGAVTSAFIRGGNSNYNLVMVDGIPLNDFGGAFDLAPLPTDGVEQVEVTRGPMSALYGSNAVAGVINVVSESGEGAPHFSFAGEGGSYDTWRITTGGAGLTSGFSWAYNLSRVSTQGPVIDDTYRNQTSFLSLGYSRSPRRKFVFHFFGDAGRALFPGPYGSDPYGIFGGKAGIPFAFTAQVQDLFGYQASYTEQFSSTFQQVSTVSVSTDQVSFPATPGTFGSSSFSKNERLAANTRSEITISPKDVFVAGFEYDREQYKDTFVADPNGVPFDLPRDTYAFFAENRWNPGDRWFITTGVRVDDIRTGDLPADETNAGRPFIPAASVTKVDPRISVAYVARESGGEAFGMTRLHSSFGTGIRPPDGFELGFTDNPELKPERSISFDAGVEQRFGGDKAVIDVTYFYNRYFDQIVTLGDPLTDLSSFTSANLAKSRAYGIESSLRVQPIRALSLTGEYTWLNTAILAVDGSTEVQLPFEVGQPLLRRPRSSAAYDATWTHGRWMLNSNASIRGAVLDLEPNLGTFACTIGLQCFFRNPGYVDANAGFAYRLPRGFEIYGHLNNFLNEKYEEAFGFPALRLNFIAGVRFSFSADHSSASR